MAIAQAVGKHGAPAEMVTALLNDIVAKYPSTAAAKKAKALLLARTPKH